MKMIRNGLLGLAVIAALFASTQATASADPLTQTDVMLVFDTSGSMKPALKEATAEIEDLTARIDAELLDVRYGLSEIRDYGGSPFDPHDPGLLPWHLVSPMTNDREALAGAIAGLGAQGGGDYPEAYSRGLWEVDTNPAVGWRPTARHVIVLVADSVPHDDELDQGIPASDWFLPPPWDTGKELRETAGVAGTLVSAETDLDWQNVLQQLAAGGKTLEVVAVDGGTEVLPYWENWAARTGGNAVAGQPGQLAEEIAGLAVSAAGRPCKAVRGSTGRRLLASLRCPVALRALRAVCGTRLSIGKPLKTLALKEGSGEIHRLKKKLQPLAKLLHDIRAARFRASAPRGTRTSTALIRRLEHRRTAIGLIKLLPDVAKAVTRADFERIASDLAELDGARTCASELIAVVGP